MLPLKLFTSIILAIATSSCCAQKIEAGKEAIWGMLIGDSLSMPVHWFYNPKDIPAVYGGWIRGFVAPVDAHPTARLSLPSHGRNETSVVGRLILHGKLRYWTEIQRIHYHQGMEAGDNTLNAAAAFQVGESLTKFRLRRNPSWDDIAAQVLEDYVKFMTTPGTHNDTYAESFHRQFFADWEKAGSPTDGRSILRLAQQRTVSMLASGQSDSHLVAVGSLVMGIPWIIQYRNASEEECTNATWRFVSLTHPALQLRPYVELYARALHRVLNGGQLRNVAREALGNRLLGGRRTLQNLDRFIPQLNRANGLFNERLILFQATSRNMGIGCPIEGALKIIFTIATVYSDDWQSALLTNANIGGDNCHRGSAIGALLGASMRRHHLIPREWRENLLMKAKIETFDFN